MVALRGWIIPSGVVLLGSCAAWGLSAAQGDAANTGSINEQVARAPDRGTADRARQVDSSPANVRVAAAAPPPVQSCPAEMVAVNHSCIDRYEAHLLKRGAGGSLVAHPPYERPAGGELVAASRAGVKPQAYISQVEAAQACHNAGKRLCGLTEWHRACTGSAKATYPYGASFQAGRCNVGKKHLLSLLHGSNARNWGYRHFNDPELDKRPGFLASAGEYAGCVTAEGAHDLVGNVHEWVADRVDRTLRQKLPVKGVLDRRLGRHAGNGIFMGGFFSTLNQHGEGCNYITAAHDVNYHDYSTGFRCCSDR